MGATVTTLVFIMVISGIIESVLMFTDNPYWFLISTGGDSIASVYGGYELLMEGLMPQGGMGGGLFNFESPDIGLCAISMAGYLIVCFLLSLWISKRRQLA
jgi:hypothetical protein